MATEAARLFQESDVVCGGMTLRCYRTGGDKPPVILAHGWTNSGLCWSELASALAPHFDVIAYDARGHGRSGRLPPGPLTSPALVSDLINLMTTLGAPRAGLIGHSMGANTVARAMARLPEPPAFVILEDPPWYESAEARAGRTADWGAWIHWALSAPVKPWHTALAEYRALSSPLWSEQTLALRLDAIRQLDPRALTEIEWQWQPWQPDAAAIRCPWLLVTGEAVNMDAIVTEAAAREAVRLTPAGQWAPIANAGHNVRYDQPARYQAAVLGFLKSFIS
jgi:pimeloyl-ACP methyl ester carboxylesterase